MALILEARGLSKRFYGTQALIDMSIALEGGQVHALVGENGAGKSTLIKILGGVHAPDEGTVLMEGLDCTFNGPSDALAAGIVLIPQEIRVISAQTVAENILLGHVPERRMLGFLPVIDRQRMAVEAASLLQRFNLTLDLGALVENLSFAERQLVMIARALSRRARLLILDEPTAALEAREVERLFQVIQTLKDEGVAILFVSHRLDEVARIADVCTILRDGQVVAASGRAVPETEEMIRLITGRDLEELHRAHDRVMGEPILEVERQTAGENVTVREREVMGLAGLLGSGMTAYLRAIFGAEKSRAGMRFKGGALNISSPAQAIAKGLGLVPAERAHGLVMGLSVRENIVLPNLLKLSAAWRLDKPSIDKLVEYLMESVDIRPRDPAKLVRELSGGNQQKVIFARWLAGHADLLLLDEPTHGIDVGAKAQIHRLMREFAADGGGIIFASSEMTEVMNISDTVLAMRNGQIVAQISRDGDYNERTLRVALGG
ncbi:MAG: sugar ABC transporter ATP-binding protein [Rhodospirillales bacterium]|jgi:ABC-type sugar transport system ATPase subunit|nr:sugar ABC transporter ATP-binding protein [Rhodospirillales bacterium]